MGQSYSIAFTVDQSPEQVYDAINKVSDWWPKENEGDTDKLGTFKHRYHDVHRCTLEITELVPGKKVVWHVLDNYFSFVSDQNEWDGTKIVFDIAKKGDQTELHFTHVGLAPKFECYDACSDSWGAYVNGNLRNLIAKGKGQPLQFD